jgi:acyl-coenzyme A synthetase/AMP-(fatty) acid ligase
VGEPIGEARVRVLEPGSEDPARESPPGVEGALAISAPTLMDGYLAHPSPLRGGWFVTGDLGVRSERGRVRITGRSAFVIDVGGKKVNPAEVERVLALHPDVREVVVLPAASTDTYARLRAVVVPEPGASLDEEALRRFAREQLPPHMLPRRIELCADPPRSPTGKILRARLLAERAAP